MTAHFPTIGLTSRMTSADYALDAAFLNEEAAATARRGNTYRSHKQYVMAKRFSAVARRKAFLEQQSSKQVKTQEAA